MFGYVTVATILFPVYKMVADVNCVQRIKFSSAFALNIQLAGYFYGVLREIVACQNVMVCVITYVLGVVSIWQLYFVFYIFIMGAAVAQWLRY
jgi:hypothetical protein